MVVKSAADQGNNHQRGICIPRLSPVGLTLGCFFMIEACDRAAITDNGQHNLANQLQRTEPRQAISGGSYTT
ncbi:hypothetical protein [Adonisia turfae]|uniref:hypothetical protein n=1 Tax=Adonisia turfae TaxID=2950184 RepID=UPI0013D0CB06|nr:hypothetical protein [Adonisia turfae]